MIDILPLLMVCMSLVAAAGSAMVWMAVAIAFLALTCSILFMTATFSWMGLVLIIFYAGGLMVLFTYFLVLSPSLSFSGMSPLFALSLVILASLTPLMTILDQNNTDPFSMRDIWHNMDLWEIAMDPISLMSGDNSSLMVLAVTLLLITMVAVVNLSGGHAGNLRPYK